jgi:transcriptional regulator with XRE-family HTH domain
MQENIGKRIKNVRKNLSLSQTEFALGLNISQSAISAYEKNERIPSKNVLNQISYKYNINPEYLLNGKEPIFLSQKFLNPMIENILDVLCKAYELDEDSEKIIYDYLMLPPPLRRTVNEFFNIIKNIK